MTQHIESTSEVSLHAYDVEAVRAHFPALKLGATHFDGPGGTLVPDLVGEAVRSTLIASMANRGSVTVAERNSEAAVLAGRQAMADLVGTEPGSVVFGRSMTQLTFDFARTIAKSWRAGDEVVVSRLDHDANVRPWIYAAEASGATVRWADFDASTAELTAADVAAVLSGRTRLVALTGASNLLGTRPDLPAVAELAHSVGALLYVDGVHLSAHTSIDMIALGADFFACSPYKFLGPHCGVVAGRREVLEELHPDKLLPSTDDVPDRFELGTLPYELMAGTAAAVDFLSTLGPSGPVQESGAETRRHRLTAAMNAIEQHEDRLRERIEDGLRSLPHLTLWSRARRHTPTLLLTFHDRPPRAAYEFLAERNINAPAGTFYAYEPARRLGLGSDGGLRIGLAPYTCDDDVNRLLDALGEFLR